MSDNAASHVLEIRGQRNLSQSTIIKGASLFAVVSWGCAATRWLAKSLNSHPEIFCVHALNSVLSRPDGAISLDDLKYLQLLAQHGFTYKAVGDVHGLSRQNISRVKEAFRDRFGCAVLVREPMARLNSMMGLLQQVELPEKIWGPLEYLDLTISELGEAPQTIPYHQRYFIHAVNMLNAVTEEEAIAPIYRSEDLTTDPEKLLDFVEVLTASRVRPAADWAEQAITRGRENVHSLSNARLHLDAWQLKVLRQVVKPEAWAIYGRLGYPLPKP